jgi:tetratricopeptide (TPR) repeat protein
MRNGNFFVTQAARSLFAGGFLLSIILLQGCASTPLTDHLTTNVPAEFRQPVELENVPFFPQKEYQCGPAALATVLVDSGIAVTAEQLNKDVYLPARHGSLQAEILASARRYGRLAYRLSPSITDILAEVKHQRPVLVFQNLGIKWYPQWHYAVVVGYNLPGNKLILRSGTHKRYVMDMSVFERTWQRVDHWAVVVLKPGELPVNGKPQRFLQSLSDFEHTNGQQRAEPAYRAALSRWPNHPLLATAYANILYQQKNIEQSKNILLRLLKTHPDNAPAHNNLAYILMEQGDLVLAEKHARLAIQNGGRYIENYDDTLAQILARQGK